jgi:hypothetical protein
VIPLRRAARVALVRLDSDRYSEPRGTLGIVEEESADADYCVVSWMAPLANPDRAVSSGPIAREHLVGLGFLSVDITDEIQRRAEQLLAEEPDDLDAHEDYLQALMDEGNADFMDAANWMAAGKLRTQGWRIRRPAR